MTAMIEVHGLKKQYRLGTGVGDYGRITEAISARLRSVRGGRTGGTQDNARDTIWALNGVDMTVEQGEVVGIIGRNGAGKTTLLKLLSRITEPTDGYAVIHGRVGALLEVGTGFHPELTGRENIFLNGALIGMHRHEIRSKFDEIVEFAEIGRFIDTPVKRYSSGMYVRLAFAVAAHLEPEILIIDEVLAVGDVAFQRKCLGKMSSVAKEGRTVLFVSHNMGAVSSLCPRSVLIEEGKATFDGPTENAIAMYLERVHGEGASRVELAPSDRVVEVRELWVEDERGSEAGEIDFRTDSTLVLRYEVKERTRDVTMAVQVAVNGQPLFYTYDTDANEELREWRDAGWYEARVGLPTSSLKEGAYTLHAKIGAGREDLTDPRATVSVSVINSAEDLTHKSYRADRPGLLVASVDWETRPIDRPR